MPFQYVLNSRLLGQMIFQEILYIPRDWERVVCIFLALAFSLFLKVVFILSVVTFPSLYFLIFWCSSSSLLNPCINFTTRKTWCFVGQKRTEIGKYWRLSVGFTWANNPTKNRENKWTFFSASGCDAHCLGQADKKRTTSDWNFCIPLRMSLRYSPICLFSRELKDKVVFADKGLVCWMDQHLISTQNLSYDCFSNLETYYSDNCCCWRNHLAFLYYSYSWLLLQMNYFDKNNDH